MKRRTSPLPICTCGSRDFDAVFRGRNTLGRTEFRLACRKCRAGAVVNKTTFALYYYIRKCQPGTRFLKLFDLQ